MLSRREAMASGVAGTIALAPVQAAHAACTQSDGLRERYLAYIAAFNAKRIPDFTSYYAPDVKFMLGAKLISGRQGIIDWYEFAWTRITEHCVVRRLIVGEDGLASELETTFTAIADWPDFPSGPLRKGDVLRRIGFGHYDVQAGYFSRVATALHRVIEAPAHWSKKNG